MIRRYAVETNCVTGDHMLDAELTHHNDHPNVYVIDNVTEAAKTRSAPWWRAKLNWYRKESICFQKLTSCQMIQNALELDRASRWAFIRAGMGMVAELTTQLNTCCRFAIGAEPPEVGGHRGREKGIQWVREGKRKRDGKMDRRKDRGCYWSWTRCDVRCFCWQVSTEPDEDRSLHEPNLSLLEVEN
jgi:hypothetical protein